MSEVNPQRISELRTLINVFLESRRDKKIKLLEKEEKEGPQRDEKRAEFEQEFVPATWLADAAKRVVQVQAVTHSLKPIHPYAVGTNLFCDPRNLPSADVVGSHCLGDNFEGDAVGNAAALDVYKFLSLTHEGQSLLDMSSAGDSDLAAAFHDDSELAAGWMKAFSSVKESRGQLASHSLAKQVFWPIPGETEDDTNYHLLGPLYASSLAHRVYEVLQENRFSEEAKAARTSRKENMFSERPVREYPQLAVQQLGGTQPQNISTLNSERRGNNSLLASLPPVWRSSGVKPLLHTDSMFPGFGRRKDVRDSLNMLLAFLKSDPKRNLETRNKRAAMVEELIDAFLQFTAEFRTLEPGWTQMSACRLSDLECRWLDPEGVAQTDSALARSAPTDVEERISAAFANWLNSRLRDPLPMGDAEFLAWRNAMHEEIKAQEREGAYAD